MNISPQYAIGGLLWAATLAGAGFYGRYIAEQAQPVPKPAAPIDAPVVPTPLPVSLSAPVSDDAGPNQLELDLLDRINRAGGEEFLNAILNQGTGALVVNRASIETGEIDSRAALREI